jgi:hypothetical protein
VRPSCLRASVPCKRRRVAGAAIWGRPIVQGFESLTAWSRRGLVGRVFFLLRAVPFRTHSVTTDKRDLCLADFSNVIPIAPCLRFGSFPLIARPRTLYRYDPRFPRPASPKRHAHLLLCSGYTMSGWKLQGWSNSNFIAFECVKWCVLVTCSVALDLS